MEKTAGKRTLRKQRRRWIVEIEVVGVGGGWNWLRIVSSRRH